MPRQRYFFSVTVFPGQVKRKGGGYSNEASLHGSIQYPSWLKVLPSAVCRAPKRKHLEREKGPHLLPSEKGPLSPTQLTWPSSSLIPIKDPDYAGLMHSQCASIKGLFFFFPRCSPYGFFRATNNRHYAHRRAYRPLANSMDHHKI
jgi:hypothetical protein